MFKVIKSYIFKLNQKSSCQKWQQNNDKTTDYVFGQAQDTHDLLPIPKLLSNLLLVINYSKCNN